MNVDADYQFRPAQPNDAPLLRLWLSRSHVRAWWDDEDPLDPESLADPRVRRWIVSRNNKPFAYMQDYTVHGWSDHHFYGQPKGTRGIDQYIGEPDMIGQGHGSAFMTLRVQALFDGGAPVVVTDPHPENARAIAAYKKVGFEIFGEPIESKWGVVLPMKMELPSTPISKVE